MGLIQSNQAFLAAKVVIPYQLGADHAASKHGFEAITSCFFLC